MAQRFTIALMATLCCALWACGPAENSASVDAVEPVEPSTYTWHEDVRPIFHRSCLGCHSADGISGIDLSSPAATVVWGDAIASAVSERRMPPWTAAPDCADYEGDFSLSDDEIEVIVDWALHGMPEGDPAAAAPLPEPYEPPTLPRVDHVLQMPVAYQPTQAPDDYRCFLLDLPFEEDVWVTGFHVQPGNEQIAHHAIPYLIPPEDVEAFQSLDDNDPLPGYRCFGGPGGTVLTLQRMRWLGAWAPGGGAQIMPEGLGLRVQAGSKVALQMHYHVDPEKLGDPALPADQTSVELQVETEPQGWADMQPWTEISWLLGYGMEIPAQSEGVIHEFRYPISDQRFSIRGAALHMHELGRDAQFSVIHADGTESCVVHEDRWDFNWQRTYRLQEPVQVGPGDEIVLRCTWDNPGDIDVKWGDGTGDEMCLAISLLSGALSTN